MHSRCKPTHERCSVPKTFITMYSQMCRTEEAYNNKRQHSHYERRYFMTDVKQKNFSHY